MVKLGKIESRSVSINSSSKPLSPAPQTLELRPTGLQPHAEQAKGGSKGLGYESHGNEQCNVRDRLLRYRARKKQATYDYVVKLPACSSRM
jgi:hypothetical protein